MGCAATLQQGTWGTLGHRIDDLYTSTSVWNSPELGREPCCNCTSFSTAGLVVACQPILFTLTTKTASSGVLPCSERWARRTCHRAWRQQERLNRPPPTRWPETRPTRTGPRTQVRGCGAIWQPGGPAGAAQLPPPPLSSRRCLLERRTAGCRRPPAPPATPFCAYHLAHLPRRRHPAGCG